MCLKHALLGPCKRGSPAPDSDYLGIRLNVDPKPIWFVQRLDFDVRPVGAALELGFLREAVAHETLDGGALVVAGGVTGTGGLVRAWRFGPDGACSPDLLTAQSYSCRREIGRSPGTPPVQTPCRYVPSSL